MIPDSTHYLFVQHADGSHETVELAKTDTPRAFLIKAGCELRVGDVIRALETIESPPEPPT